LENLATGPQKGARSATAIERSNAAFLLIDVINDLEFPGGEKLVRVASETAVENRQALALMRKVLSVRIGESSRLHLASLGKSRAPRNERAKGVR
jgi:hypothetical protein